jgi:hypothetical protein
MTEGDELLSKADALLSRYRSAPAPDYLADFPVLTEVVELPLTPEYSDGILPPASEPEMEEPAHHAPVEIELQELEHQLHHRILEAIEPRLASLLGESLEPRIRAELDAAMGQIAGDVAAVIRSEAGDLVLRAVTEAVEHEFSKLHAGLDKT